MTDPSQPLTLPTSLAQDHRMLFNLKPIRQRDPSEDCPAGKQWYSCGANGFDGCRVQDAYSHDCLEKRDAAGTITITVSTTMKTRTADATEMDSTISHVTSAVVGTPATAEPIATSAVGPPATGSAPTDTAVSITEASPTEASPTGPTAVTLTAPPAQPTVANGVNNPNEDPVLSTPAIVGITVGGGLFLIGLAFVIFLLIRRRKLAKRMPSFIDPRGDSYDEKLVAQNRPVLAGQGNSAAGVFAPFGGRSNSFESHRPGYTPSHEANSTHGGRDPPSGRVSALSYRGQTYHPTPVSPQSTGPGGIKRPHISDAIEEEKSGVPVQLDSTPVYFELDSRDTQKPMAELPSPDPEEINQGSSSGSAAPIIHPSPLTPGFSAGNLSMSREGTMMAGKDGAFARASQRGSRKSGSPARVRATLNATADERATNRHVTSWAQMITAP